MANTRKKNNFRKTKKRISVVQKGGAGTKPVSVTEERRRTLKRSTPVAIPSIGPKRGTLRKTLRRKPTVDLTPPKLGRQATQAEKPVLIANIMELLKAEGRPDYVKNIEASKENINQQYNIAMEFLKTHENEKKQTQNEAKQRYVKSLVKLHYLSKNNTKELLSGNLDNQVRKTGQIFAKMRQELEAEQLEKSQDLEKSLLTSGYLTEKERQELSQGNNNTRSKKTISKLADLRKTLGVSNL
jgi:hypothetical protein